MEPMKPEEVARLLKARPNVTHDEVREYHKLVAQRLHSRPPGEERAMATDEDRTRETRLKELHDKLFK
jgi:hypothetical protein